MRSHPLMCKTIMWIFMIWNIGSIWEINEHTTLCCAWACWWTVFLSYALQCLKFFCLFFVFCFDLSCFVVFRDWQQLFYGFSRFCVEKWRFVNLLVSNPAVMLSSPTQCQRSLTHNCTFKIHDREHYMIERCIGIGILRVPWDPTQILRKRAALPLLFIYFCICIVLYCMFW